MTIQFKDDGILFVGGSIAFHADCCCGDEPCCGITDFSVTLTGTITDKTGDAIGMPDTVSLPRTGAHWESASGVLGACKIRVNCSDQDPSKPDSEVQWWLENTGCWTKEYRISVTCSPMVIVFHAFIFSGGGGSFTLTVTL